MHSSTRERYDLYGMQPSFIHLGHLFMMKHISTIQSKMILMIADIHREFNFVEANISDLVKSTAQFLNTVSPNVYLQSDIPFQSALTFYLFRFVDYSILNHICNFKSSYISRSHFIKLIYPILMTADCIAHSPVNVIIGKDQIHNMRIIRDTINRINANVLANSKDKIDVTFTMLDEQIRGTIKEGKMSSSDPENTIFIHASDDEIMSKIRRIVTTTTYPKTLQEIENSDLAIFDIANLLDIPQDVILNCQGYKELKEHMIRNILSIKTKLESSYIDYNVLRQHMRNNAINLSNRVEENFNLLNALRI